MTISAVTTLAPSYAILLATADRNMAETGMQQNPSNHAPSASGTGMQMISGEAVLDALKLVLLGAPLVEVFTSVTRFPRTRTADRKRTTLCRSSPVGQL